MQIYTISVLPRKKNPILNCEYTSISFILYNNTILFFTFGGPKSDRLCVLYRLKMFKITYTILLKNTIIIDD